MKGKYMKVKRFLKFLFYYAFPIIIGVVVTLWCTYQNILLYIIYLVGIFVWCAMIYRLLLKAEKNTK